MGFAKESAVWMGLWLLGCILFDFWLKLEGAWLMGGGVITYLVCDSVLSRMRHNVEVSRKQQLNPPVITRPDI